MAVFVSGFVVGLLAGVGGLFLLFLFGASVAEHETHCAQGFPRISYFIWLVPILGVAAVCFAFNLVDSAVVLLLLLAVLTVARFGGLARGLLATALCAVSLAIIFLPDAGTFWVHERNDQVVVGLFLGCATLGSLLVGNNRKLA
jgi:K+-sensing histidine kinase KdpD